MKQPKTHAFSLVEVVLAIGVAGVCLLAIFGLLPIAQQTARNATEETAAPRILKAVAADLRATPSTLSASRAFGISIPSNTSADSTTLFFTAEGEYTTALTPGSRYRLTVQFSPNPTGSDAATFATLRCTWPATAAPDTAADSAEYFVALLRN